MVIERKKESGGYLKIASFKNAENSENSEKSLRRNPMEICARLEPPFQTREKLCQVSHQNIKKWKCAKNQSENGPIGLIGLDATEQKIPLEGGKREFGLYGKLYFTVKRLLGEQSEYRVYQKF